MSPRNLVTVLTLVVFYQTFANLCIQHPSLKTIKTFPHTTLIECRGLCWLIRQCTLYEFHKNISHCKLGQEIELTSFCATANEDVKNKLFFRKDPRPPVTCAGCFPGCKQKMDMNVTTKLDRDTKSQLDRDTNSFIDTGTNSKLDRDASSKLDRDASSKLDRVDSSQLDRDASNLLDRETKSQLDRDTKSQLDRDAISLLDRDTKSQLDRDAKSQLDMDANSNIDRNVKGKPDRGTDSTLSILDRDVNSQLNRGANESTSTILSSEYEPHTTPVVAVDKRRKRLMKLEDFHCPIEIRNNLYLTCNLTSENIIIIKNNITGTKVRCNLDLTRDTDTLLFMSYEVKSGRQRFSFNTRINGRWARETRHYPKQKIGKELWPYQVRVCPKVFKIRLNNSRPIYILRRSSKFPAMIQTSQNYFIDIKVMKTSLPCKRKKS